VRAWLEIREPLERQLEPLGRAAMAALRLSPGQRVLDVGCGIGGTPAALARAVGPDGSVLALDLLEDAINVARRDPELPETVEFQCGDAQTFLFEQGVFDAVFSRFGTMFFADPRAAFRNLKTALRADGRLSFVCWRRFEENELDALPLRAAAPHLPAELALASQEGVWFSFSEADAVRAVLWDAGFVDVEIAPHNEMVGSGSLKAMVDVCSRVGALGAVLRDHSYLRSKAMPALERALAERDGPSGPALQAATWIVSARAS